MVRRLIWSAEAQQNRKDIFEYWNKKNKSKRYSQKLNQLFREAIHSILRFPAIGKSTEWKGVRAKVAKDYLIFYKEEASDIQILLIWDTRRNPQELGTKLK